TITRADIDARVGGRYRMTMQPRNGEPYNVIGEYRELASPERLSFTWKWEGGSMGELPETTVMVTVKEQRADHGIETVVTLLHSEPVTAICPFGRVPAFRDGDFTLYETSAIIRYLDESFDGPSLVAGTTEKRAMMEQWTSLYNSHCYDAMVRRYLLQYIFPKGADGKPDRTTIDGAVPDIEKQLGVFDRAYGDRNVLGGDTLTLP